MKQIIEVTYIVEIEDDFIIDVVEGVAVVLNCSDEEDVYAVVSSNVVTLKNQLEVKGRER